MKKYRVYGTTTVTVTKEVWANNEEEAYEKAYNKLSRLTEYVGNGGYDKIVGVEEHDESVAANEDIEYDDFEVLEENPDYFECPECEEACEKCEQDDGTEYWYCPNCEAFYDEDGDEFYPDVYEEDE